MVPRRRFQGPEQEGGGGKTNIPTQARWPVIVVGSDGGVMRGCGDPFWETVERAYRSCPSGVQMQLS